MKDDRPIRDNKNIRLVKQQNNTVAEDEYQEVPFLSDIGLVTTYHCQASCLHCIVEAGPKRKEYVPLADAHSWLEQISHYNNGQIKAVSLTGGEPFSNLEHLIAISEKAASLGLLVTAVTNAYWATSDKVALNILENLPAIRLLTFSTDIYHQRVIPLERVKNAFMSGQALGRSCNIAVCTGSVIDAASKKTLKYLAGFAPPDAINTAHIFPVGRARHLGSDTQYPTLSTPSKVACSMAHAPVILPNGRVIACFGPIVGIKSYHPLLLGNLYEVSLSDILTQAELNSILHAIRVWGPYKLIDMIKDAGLGDCLPKKYVAGSICCTCYDLLRQQKLKAFFRHLKQDKEFLATVAYGRVYYLQEKCMAEMLSCSY